MKYIIIILFLFLGSQVKAQGCLNANIILLVDMSDSEAGNEPILASAVYDFVSNMVIGKDRVRIGITMFNSITANLVPLSENKDSIITAIYKLSLMEVCCGTFALNATEDAVYQLANADPAKYNIIIMLSDGDITDIQYLLDYIETNNILSQIDIFAIQIGGSNRGTFNLCLVTGNCNNVVVSKIDDLVAAFKKLDLCN
jgi:uncharacterized protein with von Willebrand factor type A (vWA) domain